jgi:hypothetical protein
MQSILAADLDESFWLRERQRMAEVEAGGSVCVFRDGRRESPSGACSVEGSGWMSVRVKARVVSGNRTEDEGDCGAEDDLLFDPAAAAS